MNEINEIILRLESFILNPRKGLPEDVFLFLTRNTPMINTDLLIKNDRKQTLLTWRDDEYDDPGWHIPGGIIRYKESFSERIIETARKELGTGVEFNPVPLAINECILPQMTNRAHFVSFLFACSLTGEPDRALEYRGGDPHTGEWMWHDRCPDKILSGHQRIYRKFIDPD